MNKLKAWWHMDNDWYFEVYKVSYPNSEKLSEEEKLFLSKFKSKSDVQTALNNIGMNLYWGPRISLRQGVYLLKKSWREL